MSQEYRPKEVFEELDWPEKNANTTESLAPTQTLDESEFEAQLDEQTADIDEAVTQSLVGNQPKKARGWLALLVAFLLLMIWQSCSDLWHAYLQSDWLEVAWGGFLLIAVLLGGRALAKEWWILRRLKYRQSEREHAEELLSSNRLGEAKPFCCQLANQIPSVRNGDGFQRWSESICETHNDQEVLALYDDLVLNQQDRQARFLVAKYSKEAAIMVSVSSLAVADVMLVAWRNLRLLDALAEVYGVELGYWSRIKLLKLVLFNMAVTGATEVMTDAGMNFLSVDLAGRVSARIAQGIGVGLLTGRLGLKAMSLMRPLPWQPNKQPKLSEIRRDLLLHLAKKDRHLSSAMQENRTFVE